MKRFLNFLSDRTILTILLVVVYYLLVVLLHGEVSDLFIRTVKGVPRNVYQGIVFSIGAFLFILYIFLIIRNISIHEWKRSTIFYFSFTLLFVVLSFEIIIVHNIEIIHFAQYAGLSVLLFPLLKRFGDTVFWATILGFIDEVYQYLYLKPDGTDYFDFNDVILNLLGAGLGVILIFSSGFYLFRLHWRKWFGSAVNITLLLLVIVVLILFHTSVISLFPPADGSRSSAGVPMSLTMPGIWSRTACMARARPWPKLR